jgi:hypothetical protein
MKNRKDYAGPATLSFADGAEVSVRAEMVVVRSFFSEYGEGLFETDSDTAFRAANADDPLMITTDDGLRASIIVKDARVQDDSGRCLFTLC